MWGPLLEGRRRLRNAHQVCSVKYLPKVAGAITNTAGGHPLELCYGAIINTVTCFRKAKLSHFIVLRPGVVEKVVDLQRINRLLFVFGKFLAGAGV
jgi:hypothetical protein